MYNFSMLAYIITLGGIFMIGKKEIVELLDKNNIKYELIEHEAVFTMEDIDKLNIKDKGVEVKKLFLRDEKGKNHYLIVAKEDTNIDMKELKNIINSTRLSFASEERLNKYLKLTRGCVSPFGILNDDLKEVKVFIDMKLKNESRIGVHPNENTSTIFISTSDIEKIIKCNGNFVSYVNI